MENLLETKKRRYKAPYWTNMPAEAEKQIVLVSTGSAEYKMVVSGIHETLPARINYVVRIQNPYLWGLYLLKKAEYKCRLGSSFSEKILYHETHSDNVDTIASNNFDWRLSGYRAKYGEGVSFSYSAQYAHTKCTYGGAMIVSRVLVGNTQPGRWHLKIPSKGKDTCTSDRGQDCCNVYVKFSDHEFYPQYVVYFQRRK